jgi:hypothetical protein
VFAFLVENVSAELMAHLTRVLPLTRSRSRWH